MSDLSSQSGKKEIKTLQLIYYRHWIVLSIIFFIILGTLLWSIFGKIGVQATGQGIILPDNKGIYAISSQGAGIIQEVKIRTGEDVKKGEVIAVVDQTKLAVQLKQQRQYIAILEKNYQSIQALTHKHLGLINNLYLEKNVLLNDYKKSYSQYLDYLDQLTQGEKALAKKGYISEVQYQQLKQNTAKLSLQLKQYLSTKTQNDIERNTAYLQIEQTLTSLQEQIDEEKAQLAIQESNFQQYKYITSSKDGTVLSVDIAPGQYIATGSIAATIATGKFSADHFVAFFDPLTYSRLVKSGMSAYVVPSFLSEYQYGSIKGKIIEIDRFPQSTNAINAIVNNSALTQFVSNNNQPMLMAQVKLSMNKATPSGYAWTSHQGPPYAIPVGTICDIKIIVEYRRPISFVLPFIRKAIGVDE
ncbi:NHLP bacteriocin system secretion protein [Facilibium subflavum]|uniref:NHLP bacteriocin system secretion protein n=1 Tax=Facilibium subflavum TaxID=2219058 RepID=UPI0013C3287A|nr:NHLP bacteriocin system secretion protein [Facilibium subflavum]